MVELQIINKILKTKSLDIVHENNLTPDHFMVYGGVYDFIVTHHTKYGVIPDDVTILDNFEGFDLIDVTDSDRYLTEKLKEEKLYADCIPVVKKLDELLQADSNAAIEYLMHELPRLQMGVSNTRGTDLIAQAAERLLAFRQKKANPAQFFASTGFPELDEILTGLNRKGDLMTILARTNQGKTWMLMAVLVYAWKQNLRVGFYSPEMDTLKVGYRFDALFEHFSNLGLIRATEDEDKYEQYIEALQNLPTPFIVITPSDLGGRATVSRLKTFCIQNKIDVLGVDQYSLMDDDRKSPILRIQQNNITADLLTMGMELGVAVVGCVQSNRLGAKKKEGEEEAVPELENAAESDGIVQNSRKVVSLRQTGAGLKMAVIKNDGGRVGDELTYFWNIDTGEYKYMSDSSTKRESGGNKKAINKTKEYGTKGGSPF